MKILTLRFSNLNSLQGEWEIDFTRPEYVSDGLFAITGPTGSGKSTILDAICLALYGQTPRLGRITKSSNEVMSRHAGDCFSEVTFATPAGTYRCHWSQHRSRRRPGGELQAQKHEIADALTGKLIQSKVQETLLEVEARTGMDYDRFTRSMLLAQGDFAAFLKAEADQRAPVLEQITGTELYSIISVKVHERRRAEQEQLQRLELDAGAIQLLAPETLAELDTTRQELLVREQEQSEKLETDATALRWLEEVSRLEEALTLTIRETEALQAELELFAEDAQRLDRARIAALVEPACSAVQLMREQLRLNAEELARKDALRPEAASLVERDETACLQAAQALAEAEAAVVAARPLIAAVRRLDEQIAGRSVEVERLTRECAVLEERQAQLVKQRQATATALDSVHASLLEQQTWQAQNRNDATLTGALSGIRHAIEELQIAAVRQSTAETALSVLRDELQALGAELALAESATGASRLAAEEASRLLNKLKEEFGAHLGGSTLKALRRERDQLGERYHLFEQIAQLYVTGKELAPKIERIEQLILESGQRLEETRLKVDHARELLAHAEREAASQEQLERLADRVRSLEEERLRLIEGEPCPLCGSTGHPWVFPGAGLPQSLGEALPEARRLVQVRSAALREHEIAFAETASEIGQSRQHSQELAAQRESYGRKCLVLLKQAGVETSPREAEPVVTAALAQIATQRGELAARIERLESDEQRIHDEESALSALNETVHTAQHHLARLTERQRSMKLDLVRHEQEHERWQQEHNERRRMLHTMIEPFVSGAFDDKDYATLLAQLQTRSEQWILAETRIRSLDQECLTGQTRLKSLDEQLAALRSDCADKCSHAETSREQLQALKAQRTAQFGDKESDAEEVRLERTLQAAREVLDAATTGRIAAREALVVLDSAIAASRRTVEERRKVLDEREDAFSAELRAQGFGSEAEFLAARLDGDERQRLETKALSIEKRMHETEARSRERQERLGEVRVRQLTSESVVALNERIAERQEALRGMRERIGAITSRLAENARALGDHRLKLQAAEAQRIECRRWELLHDLVGSSDGKKFRNFAQGITFEIVITHANRQLRRMTDRYLLQRNASAPLELDVIDQWQAGEVRSTRNLSGGESFIVSLALALGLSQMSSRSVRVDSLFLDEGFGTLDEEALETALETLGSLQQSGKLIGVISHVAALRERIATHIRVRPLTGGRSVIEGPGVVNRNSQ